MPTRRQHVHSCQSPHTYKYELAPDRALDVLEACARAFGEWRMHPTLPIVELECTAFRLRAPQCGTPLTVIFEDRCEQESIDALHRILEFSGVAEEDPA